MSSEWTVITNTPTNRAAFTDHANQAPVSFPWRHTSDDTPNHFDKSAYFAHLNTTALGQWIIFAASTSSTQAFAREHKASLPDGAVVHVLQQTQGTGRGSNVWTSPHGCLMFTAKLTANISGLVAPFINYVCCLAVVQGIEDLVQQTHKDLDLKLQIKWPNDIYCKGHKIGGVLINSTYRNGAFGVLIGIGLNVRNEQPTICLNQLIQTCCTQQHLAPFQVNLESVLGCILTQLERCFKVLEDSGFGPLEAPYLKYWMHQDQKVKLVEAETGAGRVEQEVDLTIKGISSTGFLLALDSAGNAYELTPDGNSLDMMQGLIKRKL